MLKSLIHCVYGEVNDLYLQRGSNGVYQSLKELTLYSPGWFCSHEDKQVLRAQEQPA